MSPKILSEFLLGLSELLAKTAKEIKDGGAAQPTPSVVDENKQTIDKTDACAVDEFAKVCAQLNADAKKADKPTAQKSARDTNEAPCTVNGTTAYFSFTHSDKARKQPFQWHSRIDSNISGNIGHPFDVAAKNDSNHCRTEVAKVFLAQTFGVRDSQPSKRDLHLIVCALGRAEKLSSAKHVFAQELKRKDERKPLSHLEYAVEARKASDGSFVKQIEVCYKLGEARALAKGTKPNEGETIVVKKMRDGNYVREK